MTATKAEGKKPATLASSDEQEKTKALGRVELLLYTGKFTRDNSSGVDMLVVGDVNQRALEKFVSDIESKEGKEILYVLLSSSEFEYRRQIKDRFIVNVLGAKKQIIVDTKGVLQHA
jgi:hypothetical protein